jgi:hypothetical protein
MRNSDGTPISTLVARDSQMILSGSDYEVGFLQQVRAAGWSGPVLEYIDLPFAMGPSSALSGGSCPAGYEGYTTTWTSGANEFCSQVNPNESWFLHNGAGQRIYRNNGDGSYLYIMNPASSGWRSYVVAKVGRIASSYHMDGLFLDDAWATATRPRSRETNSDGTCRECGTDAQWHAAVLGELQAIKAAGGSRPAWVNTDDTAQSGYPSAVDGFMIEDLGTGWCDGCWMGQSEIEQRLTDVDAAVAAGKQALLVGQGDSRQSLAQMRFSHALYLMVAGSNVTYRFHNASDYRSFWDYPEFSWELGSPSGPRYKPSPTVFRRDFSNGAALANMGASSVTLNLGASYILPDGSRASSVTLGSHQGMALRR